MQMNRRRMTMIKIEPLDLSSPATAASASALPEREQVGGIPDKNLQASGAEQPLVDSNQNPQPGSPNKDKSQFQRLLSSIGQFASVGTLLRLFGSASMVVALCFFLLDGYHAGNHMQRFWLLMAFSAISVISGFLMSRIFSDQKGARTMVTVALLSVPTCFAVLGALVYSHVPLDGLKNIYPDYLLWQSGSLSQLLLAGTVCTLITGTVSWFGFSVLARQIRLPLFSALILGSALLVIPVRNSVWVALVGFAMISIVAIVLLRYVMPRLTLKTHWSSFSLLLTALPIVILICRSAWLYDMSAAMMFACAAGLYCALIYIARNAGDWALSLTESALLVAGAALVLFAHPLLNDLARSGWPIVSTVLKNLRYSDTLILLAALIAHLDFTLKNRGIAKWSRIIFSTTLFLAFLESSFMYASSMIDLTVAAAVAASMAGYGLYRRYPFLIIIGGTLIFALLLIHHNDIFGFIHGTGLLGLLAFGTVCVFSAHLFEKYGPLLRARYSLKAKISNQDA